MIIKLAWRNVWRNKVRSGILLAAITFGLWGGISAMGIMQGMNDQRIKSFLETQVSHIQIHDPAFVQDQDVSKYLKNSEEYLPKIQELPEVKGAAPRVVVNGMVSSPTNSSGVQITGIKPELESNVTTIHEQISIGTYFQKDARNPVVMGAKLADQMGVEQGSKVVLNFQDLNGDITSGAFTIVGLFKTSNAQFDKGTLFIPLDNAYDLLGAKGVVHEIALLLNERAQTGAVVKQLKAMLPSDYLVQGWRQVQPSLAYLNDFSTEVLYFILVIILLGLAFGILNTMLMAVMERTRELGMLMAVGLNKPKVFKMVVIETIFLSLQGAVFGMLIGWGTINYFGNYGINLASFAEGLASFGYSDKIYPVLDDFHYPVIAGMVILTAVLSAIYPAIKALKLKPAEAIREI